MAKEYFISLAYCDQQSQNVDRKFRFGDGKKMSVILPAKGDADLSAVNDINLRRDQYPKLRDDMEKLLGTYMLHVFLAGVIEQSFEPRHFIGLINPMDYLRLNASRRKDIEVVHYTQQDMSAKTGLPRVISFNEHNLYQHGKDVASLINTVAKTYR
jgi:hypothetical protein